jgi:phospholipid N-methyltransferase
MNSSEKWTFFQAFLKSPRVVASVISGIPFSTLPETLAAEIVAAVHTALGPGGRFVAYQFTDRVAHYVWPLMGAPEVEYELRNVPPLRVFTWRKESGSGTAANGRSEPGLSIWQ